MKKILHRAVPLLLALALLLGAVPSYAANADAGGLSSSGGTSAALATVAGFQDVNASAYYADAVQWAKETGVTAGTSATTFSPSATVTRAEAMTFLWVAAGRPEPATKTSPFSDVTPSDYCYKPVLWAAENGITGGVSPSSFGRNNTLTYDQILTFLRRASGDSSNNGDWSAEAVSWAEENGLTDGLTMTAKTGCPRSDVVYFLWKQLSGESGESSEEESSPVEQPADTPTGLSDLEGAKAAIVNGFAERSGQIVVSSYNVESSALMALAEEIADQDGKNPYNISTLTCGQKEGQRALFLQVSYLAQTSASSSDTSNPEVQARVREIVGSVVTSGMSDYEIAKVLHDWLVLNCKYDMRLYSGNMPYTSYTAYGALMDGTCVCAGYAKAYQLLTRAAGLECDYVTNHGHGWNIIKIDGAWYHVDTTWDDPIPDKEGYVRYKYFLKSDAVMSKDHAAWTADHACTSTKYDNADLPDTAEQAKREEQAAEQVRLENVSEQAFALCVEAFTGFPYSTQAELQAAESLSYSKDGMVTITFPSGQFTYSDLVKIQDQLAEAIAAEYPDYELSGIGSNSVKIKRNDVLAEIERRNAIQRAEAAAHVAELEEVLKDSIHDIDVRVVSFDVAIPSGYDTTEIKKAWQNLVAEGYTVEGYTLGVDLNYGAMSIVKLTIHNNKYADWAEEETRRYEAMLQEGIRNRETKIVLPDGDYPDKDGAYYSFAAALRMKQEGYSFDGLTYGVDFIFTSVGHNKNAGEETVLVKYLEPAAET